MSDKIWFDPTLDKWVLSDGEHYLEVPHWAREIIVNEFERETRRLKAENAKLRNDAELLRAMLSQKRIEKQCYEAENAKLRELVRDMWEGYNDPRCEECHLKDTPTCADCPICAKEASVIDRMHELGVEVYA